MKRISELMVKEFNLTTGKKFSTKINLPAVLIIVLIFFSGLFIKLDYYIVRPSRAMELGELINVENRDPDDEGAFFLLTVSQHRATPFTILYGLVHPHYDINPISSIIPVGMDEEEYRQLQADNMAESRLMAQVVALRRAGYDIDVSSEGVEVIGFLENAPAEPYLREGDKLIIVDGKRVILASEVPLIVQEREVGESIGLTVIRDGRLLEMELKTGEHPEESGLPFLGIYIKTLPWEAEIPVNIVMDTGRIGGPSAGMMFTLEIINQIIEGDLTAGKKIAGTGTIDFTEKIGRIGGVAQKVIAAERVGAEVIFVPEANYSDALKAARRIIVVPVSDLDQALEFLSNLEAEMHL
jgi:Lon-like protease